jgi:hypothetical protein
MKLTKLQNNNQIYYNLYAIVHNKVREICQAKNDSDHLLVTRFNDSQVNPEEFKQSLLELFYAWMLPSSWNYLRWTCCKFYDELKDLPQQQNLFIDEYQEFIHLFD